MSQVRSPKENEDEDGTLYGDTWMLATCRPVEIMRWNCGDDREETGMARVLRWSDSLAGSSVVVRAG